MRLSSIKVPSRWRNDYRVEHVTVAHFTLGPGPCGKDVTELRLTIDVAGVTVTQVHSDDTWKRFHYPAHVLTGRVEEEWLFDN